MQVLGAMDPGSQLRLKVKGEKDNGKEYQMTVMLAVGDEATGEERLSTMGIETRDEAGKVIVDLVAFASPAEKANIDFDQEILSVQMKAHRPPKQLMFFPALLLLALIWKIQKGRVRRETQLAAA